MFSNEEIDTNVKNCKMKQFVKIVSVFLEVGGGGRNRICLPYYVGKIYKS